MSTIQTIGLLAYVNAPRIAAGLFAAVKYSVLVGAAAATYSVLESRGVVPQTSIDDVLLCASTTVAVASFDVAIYFSAIQPSGQVPRGSSPFERFAMNARRSLFASYPKETGTKSLPNKLSTTNWASVFYYDRRTRTYRVFSASNGKNDFREDGSQLHTHSERKLHEFLKHNNVRKQDVIAFHSDLEPCGIPSANAGCANLLEKEYPDVPVSWNYPYPPGLSGTPEDAIRRQSVQRLAEDVLLKVGQVP